MTSIGNISRKRHKSAAASLIFVLGILLAVTAIEQAFAHSEQSSGRIVGTGTTGASTSSSATGSNGISVTPGGNNHGIGSSLAGKIISGIHHEFPKIILTKPLPPSFPFKNFHHFPGLGHIFNSHVGNGVGGSNGHVIIVTKGGVTRG